MKAIYISILTFSLKVITYAVDCGVAVSLIILITYVVDWGVKRQLSLRPKASPGVLLITYGVDWGVTDQLSLRPKLLLDSFTNLRS